MADGPAADGPAADDWRNWPARAPKTLILAGLVLAVIAGRDLIGVAEFLQRTDTAHPDFFGLWSFARFAAARPAAEIYDPVALQAFQLALSPDFQAFYPFAYPPPMLLLLAPLGWMGFGTARAVFSLGSWLGFALVAVWFARPSGVRLRAGVLLAALAAPASMYCLLVGQNGLLFGALLLGGLGLLARRPVVAGLLFGLLACKPQFGLLLPFALLGSAAWRTIGATVATMAALALASVLAFGWDVWLAWGAGLGVFGAMLTAQMAYFLPLMASPAAGLLRVGVPPGLAMGLQAAITVALAGMAWWLFRRAPTLNTQARDAPAALLPAVGLASPYVFAYDLPMVVGCIAWLFADRHRRDGGFHLAELLALLAALLAPAFLLHAWLELPVVAASLAWLFVVAVRRALAAGGNGENRG